MSSGREKHPDTEQPLFDCECEVVTSGCAAPGYRYLEVRCPEPDMATSARPGQFVQVRCSDGNGSDPLLRRPISICTANTDAATIGILVKDVGRGSRWLTQRRVGDTLGVLGPLGKGFALPSEDSKAGDGSESCESDGGDDILPILVGGGFGVAPLLFLAQTLSRFGSVVRRPIALVGASCAEGLLFVDELSVVCDLRISTDDGSCGALGGAAAVRRGFVTELLEEVLDELSGRDVRPQAQVFACGPLPMMRRCCELAARFGIDAQISLEERMACGVGACLVCACAVKAMPTHPTGSYKRVCADGPVFRGSEVDWDV